jgi:predicted anti-sigma-YlaC factor YlaD
MHEQESFDCASLACDAIRYALRELPEESWPTVKAHLDRCKSCRELVSFAEMLTATAGRSQAKEKRPADHPDPSLIADLEADNLDPETARKVSLHLLDCKPCREAYLRLRSLTDVRFEQRVLAADTAQPPRAELPVDEGESEPEWYSGDPRDRWQKFLEDELEKTHLIDLGKYYEVGANLGPPGVQLIAAKPAFSVVPWESALYALLARGLFDEALEEGRAEGLSKTFEIWMDVNLYQVEIAVRLDGKFSVGIATLRTTSRLPLRISLWETAGEEIEFGSVAYLKTDSFGKANCVGRFSGSGLRVLTLILQKKEKWIPFWVPRDVFRVFENDLIKTVIDLSSREEIAERLRRTETAIESLKRRLWLEATEPSSWPTRKKDR